MADPAPDPLGGLETSEYPAWLLLGLVSSALIALYACRWLAGLVWYPGRPTRAEVRRGVTRGLLWNPNISLLDKLLQFFFPLLVPLGRLCWEGEGADRTGPTPAALADVRRQLSGLSDHDAVVPDMGYAVSAATVRGVAVVLYAPTAPATEDATLPALVVWCHGGGLTLGGARDPALVALVRQLTGRTRAEGAALPVFASVEYRLAPEHTFPAPIDDVYEVLRHYAKGVGKKYSSVHLAGISAGGYLALAALKRAVKGGIRVSSVFAQEPMVRLTGEHESEFANAYSRTGPPRWLKWCWDVYTRDTKDCDVYTGLYASAWWQALGKKMGAPRFVVSVAAGDAMCGAAERLVEFMTEGTGLIVAKFKTRASHGCAMCDGKTNGEIIDAFARNIYGEAPQGAVQGCREQGDSQ